MLSWSEARRLLVTQAFGVITLLLLSIATRAEDAAVRTTLSMQYYRCIEPASVTCTVLSENDQSRCARCKTWSAYVSARLITGTISEAVYIDRSKPATRFVNDLLVNVYKAPPDVAARYTPPKIAALYDNPNRFGWIELPAHHAGSVVLDRRLATFALTDLEAGSLGRGPLTPKRVLQKPSLLLDYLYPSAKKGGALSVEEATHLFKHERPKSLIPDFILQAAIEDPSDAIPLGWNTWFESPPGPSYEPVPFLQPERSYNLALHIAPFAYEAGHSEVGSTEVQGTLGQRVHRTRANNMRLTALVFTDERYVRTPGLVSPFTVDVRKLRTWTRDDAPLAPTNALAALASGGDPTWVFAELFIPIQTTGREGRSLVGISIWDESAWPIDEITIPVCIAAPERAAAVCGETAPVETSVTGFDVGAPPRLEKPSAALHLIGLGQGGITGVFHRNDIPSSPYVAWRASEDDVTFAKLLSEISEQFAEANYDPDALVRTGEALYSVLFATSDLTNASARHAETAFAEFTRRYASATPRRDSAPILFARYVDARTNRQSTRTLPLALAKPPGSPGHLGEHFRIEMPLAHHSAEPSSVCVTNWHFIAPAATAPSFPGIYDELHRHLPRWFERADIFDSMEKVRDFLGQAVSHEQSGALVFLGHHIVTERGIGRLTLEPDDFISSHEVRRQFRKTAIAILNACGTGAPGGEDFIAALNNRGFDTVISTFHPVDDAMAVAYFDCLDEVLPSGQTSSHADISAIHFDAVRCLSRRKHDGMTPYGAAALAYGILGNGSVHLCQPDRP